MNDKQLLNRLYLWYSIWKLSKKSLRMTFLTRPGLSKKKREKEKKRAESSTALTLMCAYFITPDLIRKNNLNLFFVWPVKEITPRPTIVLLQLYI